MAGLTATGFQKKTLDELRTELEDAFRTFFGVFINLLPGSVFSTLIGIWADRMSEIWDVAEEVYNSQYPDTAEGVSLDNVMRLNNIERIGSEATTVAEQIFFGDPGTIIPTSARFSVQGNPSSIFKPDAQVTLGAGTNCVQELLFDDEPDAGSFTISYNDETTSILPYTADYEDIQDALNALDGLSGVVVSGDFASEFTVEFDGDDGLQEQPLLVVNSSLTKTAAPVDCTVSETQSGVPQGLTSMTAVSTGPLTAVEGTLNVIDTPISGLTRTFNTIDGEVGRHVETDADARTRREESINAVGNASVEAIRAKVRNLDGVVAAIVVENDTNVTVDGRPPKSFEVIVDGGEDEDIAEAIWASKAGGIQPYGQDSYNIVDSMGVTRSIGFTRADPVDVYLSLDLTTDNDFPENGEDAVVDAILSWSEETLDIGESVIVYPTLMAQLNSVPGIVDVVVRIGKTAVSTTPGDPAVDSNLTFDLAEKATFTAPNINVNLV